MNSNIPVAGIVNEPEKWDKEPKLRKFNTPTRSQMSRPGSNMQETKENQPKNNEFSEAMTTKQASRVTHRRSKNTGKDKVNEQKPTAVAMADEDIELF